MLGVALVGSVLMAAGSVVTLWLAGRSAGSDGLEAALEHPATYLFAPAASLLAAALCWLAFVVARAESTPLGGTPQPAR